MRHRFIVGFIATAAASLLFRCGSDPRSQLEDAGETPDAAIQPDGSIVETGAETTVPPGDGGPAVLSIPDKRVGFFYTAWDTPAATAVGKLKAAGKTLFTVEQVLRSNRTSKVSDILVANGELAAAASFHYHATPALGFYCLYRARPGEKGAYPDCKDISKTARTHADQMIAAGADFVVVDATNLDMFETFSDAIQLRPTEVLFEEWSALRLQGVLTPQIAVWGRTISPGANIHREYLKRIYNNPAFDNVIMKDKKTGKKIMFLVDDAAARTDLKVEIESNGGKNDIIAVPMWGNMPLTKYGQGVWSFMSPCINGSGYTSTIVERPCNQAVTTNSPLGSQIAVSVSYQIGFASQPFLAAGKMDGLTLRKQFEKAFQTRPDYLFLNGWNEFIAQPQVDPANVPAMGLEHEPGNDPLFARQWVDVFGEEYARATEPSVENGGAIYELMKSCLRVYRTTKTVCDDPNEACCSTKEAFRNVYSFVYPGNGDHIITASRGERNALATSGWTELCETGSVSADFCYKAGEASGPFMLRTEGGAGRAELFRCRIGVNHFFSTSPTCEGQVVEGSLGFMGTSATSAMARTMRRCFGALGHVHTLSRPCPPGTNEEFVIGYVR